MPDIRHGHKGNKHPLSNDKTQNIKITKCKKGGPGSWDKCTRSIKSQIFLVRTYNMLQPFLITILIHYLQARFQPLQLFVEPRRPRKPTTCRFSQGKYQISPLGPPRPDRVFVRLFSSFHLFSSQSFLVLFRLFSSLNFGRKDVAWSGGPIIAL